MTASASAHLRVARCLALDALALRVVRAFAAAGVDSIVLKGPATVHWLYPDDPGRRAYSDIDILVRPDCLAHAETVLAGLDLTPRLPSLPEHFAARVYEFGWRDASGSLIELHRGFFGVRDTQAFWDELHARATTLPMAGGVVRIPDATSAALLYALHAAQHGTQRELSRKPLVDLSRALGRFGDDIWRDAAGIATRAGAGNVFAAGLRLDGDGGRLADRLGLGTEIDAETLLLATRPTARGDVTVARVVAGSTWQERMRSVRYALLPPRAIVVNMHPWARRHRLLVPAAYAVRIGQCLPALPRAVRQAGGAHLEARRSRAPISQRAGGGRARSALRFLRRPDRARAGAAWWALRAARVARQRLRASQRPNEIVFPPLPRAVAGRPEAVLAARGTVRKVLHATGATCLEQSAVRQTWLAAGGRPRDIVVGVRKTGAGVGAHAWLAGDADSADFTELTRYPVRPNG